MPSRITIGSFQRRVWKWLNHTFGPAIAESKFERNVRFLEEALELVQSLGLSQEQAGYVVDYVYGRKQGEPAQEIGGVLVCLAALAEANNLDMDSCGIVELQRCWENIAKIRDKQQHKHIRAPITLIK